MNIKEIQHTETVDYLIQSPVEYFARVTPNQAALAVQGRTLTYSELDRKSNQLANTLIKNGALPQDRIGIFHHKELELGVAIYGALKAGCVFVPLDPFMPADRLSFIINDCGIRHIISSDVQFKVLAEIQDYAELHCYGVEKELPFDQTRWSEIAESSTSNPNVIMIDQDLGYIMYTSGSTGVPKGMMHTHHGSVTYSRWGVAYVDLTAADKVASHAPLHFDLSIFDFFSTARAGATVVLVPEAITKFPASWSSYIEKEQITIVFTVPYTLITMLEQGAMEKRDLSCLRWILFGGEPFPPTKLRSLMAVLNKTTFSNIYGPAEAPCCTTYEVPRPLPESDDPLPIGIVSSNSTDLIIDENNNESKPGESGELCIRSSTLMKGYWNRPDLSDRAFLEIKEPGKLTKIFYRTGDRVVRDDNGQLHFLGRIDRMVKTRGHRVELDEIEAVLSDHAAVYEFAAFAVPDNEHASVLIMGAVTAKPSYDLSVSDLMKLARSKLPPYAVPREIYLLSEMPHTSSGKIDRRMLVERWQKMSETDSSL